MTQSKLPNSLFAGDGKLALDARRALKHLRSNDENMARLIKVVGSFRMELKQTHDVFTSLAEAIVYQQLHGKAAATIYGRLCALFPKSIEGPTPQQILRASDEKLRGAGLSQAKMLALRDLAQKVRDGVLPTLEEIHQLDDEAIIDSLIQVRGIGRWTAEMLLMFRLGRPDVLPVDDYGIRKGFAIAFGQDDMPTRKQLQQAGEAWRPYRTVASWYLWRANDLNAPV